MRLIAVGMRYFGSVRKLKAGCNVSIEAIDSTFQWPEGADKGFKYVVRERYSYKLVAFIRERDSHYLSNELVYCTLTAVSPNYLVLESTSDSTAREKAFANSAMSDTISGEFVDCTLSTVNYSKTAIDTLLASKDTNIMNTSSMRDSFFREVKTVAIDIQTGKFGVTSAEGISVYADGGVHVNPITELGVKVPAFAMRIAVDQLTAGDILINGNDTPVFFKGKTENGYEVVSLTGEVRQVGTVTNMFFGKNTVLAVKNMFGEGTNPMLMAMLMGDEFGKGDSSKMMLMMMAMSGGMVGSASAEGFGGMNPMMLAMMMK